MQAANDNGPLGEIDRLKGLADDHNLDFSYLSYRADYCNPDSRPTSVYVISCDGFIKVGMANSPNARLATLQAACPHEMALEYDFQFATKSLASRCEKAVHKSLVEHHVRSEWYSAPPELAIDRIMASAKIIGVAA